MFTVFSLRNSEELSSREQNYLEKILSEYSHTFDGLFLQCIPWQNVKFRWCSDMTMENGIIGAFSPLHPDTIFLQKPENPDAISRIQSGRVPWLELIFPTVVHELRHLWQFKRNSLCYILCCLPLLRSLTIERDAVATAGKSEKWIGNWIQKQDALNLQERIRLMGGYSDEQNIIL